MESKSAIIGFGLYVPRLRITTKSIAKQWDQDPDALEKGLGVTQKSVPDQGEDAFTLAYEASKQALELADIQSSQISAVFVGSESHPYAVKPTSGMLSDAISAHPFCHAADLEFACKAGTAAMQIVDSMVRSKQVQFGLAVGSDTAQSRPGDALEYTAAAGAAAFIIGPSNHKNALCRIDETLSFTTDTPDFWRSNNANYPEHAGRFTGEPGYFHHVRTTIEGILEKTKTTIEDFDHIVLHMPNGKFPSRIAKEFSMTKEQMKLGFIVPTIGNTYSACSPLGLAHVLCDAKIDERILVVSYGSGAGCDAFCLTMLQDSPEITHNETVEYIEYSQYLQLTSESH